MITIPATRRWYGGRDRCGVGARRGAGHDHVPALTAGIDCIIAAGLFLQLRQRSFQPHLAAGRTRGIEPRILDLPGIALDIDTPDDLRLLIARGGETRTHAYLDASGIAARFRDDRRRAGGVAQ
jgi:2-phospho-L-lactate guanylyltransferase (CobY/MobA/RfbA family)